MRVDATLIRTCVKRPFSRFLASTYAGHDGRAPTWGLHYEHASNSNKRLRRSGAIIMSTRVVFDLARSDTPNITLVVSHVARIDTPKSCDAMSAKSNPPT